MFTSNLFDLFRPVLPENLPPYIASAFEEVEQLLGFKGWQPQRITYLDAVQIIHLGVVLAFLSEYSSLDPLRQRIADAMLNNKNISSNDMAEINAAALCCTLGATDIEHVKTGSCRTPDFRVFWADGGTVDLEVTCATQKRVHIARQKIAREISDKLLKQNASFDLILHFLGDLEAHELEAIEATASKLQLGEMAEQQGRWHLYAKQTDREPTIIFDPAEIEMPPSWWPEETIASKGIHAVVATKDAVKPLPLVRVVFGVSLDAYINPAQNKADRSQTSKTNPFLIAIDNHNLPGAFSTFRKCLPEYWSIWPHVSGILLFHAFTSSIEVGWYWELFLNPQAKYPLPEEFQAKKDIGQPPLKTSVLVDDNFKKSDRS